MIQTITYQHNWSDNDWLANFEYNYKDKSVAELQEKWYTARNNAKYSTDRITTLEKEIKEQRYYMALAEHDKKYIGLLIEKRIGEVTKC